MRDDLYAVLGVSETASQENIRSAYLRLIREAHPDIDGGNEEEAKRITVAYGVLSDSMKRAEYDRSRTAETCPFCRLDLQRVIDPDAHIFGHLATASMATACEVCGRHPASVFSFKANSGFLIFRRVYQFEGYLCQMCSRGMFREFQARNITRGPWGFFSIFAAMWYMVGNAGTYGSKKISTPPTPKVPDVDRNLQGRPVFGRPTVWVAMAIVGWIAFSAISESLANPGLSARNGFSTSDVPAVTEPVVDSAVVTAPPDWEVGACVIFVGDMVQPASCSDPLADRQVIAMVTSAEQCPLQAQYYVEVSSIRVACID